MQAGLLNLKGNAMQSFQVYEACLREYIDLYKEDADSNRKVRAFEDISRLFRAAEEIKTSIACEKMPVPPAEPLGICSELIHK